MGELAKTDAIDALVLARFAELVRLARSRDCVGTYSDGAVVGQHGGDLFADLVIRRLHMWNV
jgi:hypothetical protein